MVLIKCKCYAEMKKISSIPLKLHSIQIATFFFSCGCAARLGPACSCKHLSALCYFLEELCRLSLPNVPVMSRSSATSSTASLQTWHQPRKRNSGISCTLGSINFVKSE